VLFSTRSPPHAVLLATALSLSVVVRVLGEGARVTWVCWCWLLCCRGTLVLSPGIRSLVCWGSQGRSFPAVRSGLVGVDAAEHLIPSCSVHIHHDVFPCRDWDLAEEEVNFSRRSLLVVVSFVVVAAVAVVAVAVIAVLWGGYCMVCMW
jgi:hypothetical protein